MMRTPPGRRGLSRSLVAAVILKGAELDRGVTLSCDMLALKKDSESRFQRVR